MYIYICIHIGPRTPPRPLQRNGAGRRRRRGQRRPLRRRQPERKGKAGTPIKKQDMPAVNRKKKKKLAEEEERNGARVKRNGAGRRRRSEPQQLHLAPPPVGGEEGGNEIGSKVPCAPEQFSSSFSYSTCTNDFGAVTHNERRFQFRLFNHLFRIVPGFMGKSRLNCW